MLDYITIPALIGIICNLADIPLWCTVLIGLLSFVAWNIKGEVK